MLLEPIPSLVEALTAGSDPRAEAAVLRLAAHGLAALPALQSLLRSEEEDHRWWAVRTLAEIEHPQARPAVRKALGDPALSVRQCAALALRLHPDPQALPALSEALQAGDRLLARLAAEALIALGESAVPVILHAFEQGKSPARLEAARALALLTDLRAVPALFAALDDASPLIQYWAEEGLQRRGIGMAFFTP